MEEFADISITCVDCGDTFVFSAGEQEYFRDKKLLNQPKRCKPCKQAKQAAFDNHGSTQIQCSECGARAIVPFVPTKGKPVYCKPCFSRSKK